MEWITLVTMILRYILMMLEAINNPKSVKMVVNGKAYNCTVVKNGQYKTKIICNFLATGEPIVNALITINGRPFAKAHLPQPKLCQAGPMELSGNF